METKELKQRALAIKIIASWSKSRRDSVTADLVKKGYVMNSEDDLIDSYII